MELEELERELQQTPQEVDEAAVKEALQQAEEPQPENKPEQEPEQEPEQGENTVNLMQFGQIITNMYCGLSDYVYKRVKKTDSAPVWEPETKEAIKQSLTDFLAQYNVQMTPTTQLIVVLISVEAVRYTLKRPQISNNGTDE